MSKRVWPNVAGMNERELRKDIILPLLENTPNVEQVTDVHGTDERGLDVLFVDSTDVRSTVYGMQIKTGDIRGGGSTSQTVKQLIDQLELATDFDHPIAINPRGRKKIERCIVATNGAISNTAQREIADRLRPTKVDFWDHHELMRRIRKYYPELATGADSETLAYLTSLRERLDTLDALDQITGVASRTLSEVFVEPTLQRRMDPTMASSSNRRASGRSIPSLDLLEHASAAVVIGDQNAGKTSLLRMLGIQLVDSLLQDETTSGPESLPLFLRAQAIVRDDSVIQAAKMSLQEIGAGGRASSVTEDVEDGLYAVFIDGFSELLTEDDRNKCEAAVSRFQARYPDNYVVVAARPDDFLKPKYFSEFVQFSIQKFNTDKIKSLIRYWTQDAVDLPDVAQKMVGRVRDALQLPGSPIPAVIGVMLYEKENRFITNTAEAVDRYMVIRLGRYAQEMGIQQEVEWTRKEDLLGEVAMEMVADEVESISYENLVARFDEIFERRGEAPRGAIAIQELSDAGVLRESEERFKFHRTAFRDFFAAKDLVNRWDRIDEFFVENILERKWGQVLVFAAGLLRHNSSLLRQLESRVRESRPTHVDGDAAERYVYGAYLLGRILSNSDAANAGPRKTALITCLDGTCHAIPEFEREAVAQLGNIGELAALVGVEQTFFVTVGVPWLQVQFRTLLENPELSDEERYLLTSVYANLGCEDWLEFMVRAAKGVSSTRALVALQLLFQRLSEARNLKSEDREGFLGVRNTLDRKLEKRSDEVTRLLEVRTKLLELERRRIRRLQGS